MSKKGKLVFLTSVVISCLTTNYPKIEKHANGFLNKRLGANRQISFSMAILPSISPHFWDIVPQLIQIIPKGIRQSASHEFILINLAVAR